MLNFAILIPIPAAGAAPGDGGMSSNGFWILIGAMLVLYYVMLILPQQRERKKRQELLNSLKKNDRVVTTSGMIGTVANVSQDGKEITLKFGETTRIPFLRSAIETVLRDTAEAETTTTKS